MRKQIILILFTVGSLVILPFLSAGQITCDSLEKFEQKYDLKIDMQNDSVFSMFGQHVETILAQSSFDRKCSFSFIHDYLITSRYMETETASLMEQALQAYDSKEFPGEHMSLLAEKSIPYYMANEREEAILLLDSILSIHKKEKDYEINAKNLGKIAAAFSDFERFKEAEMFLEKAVHKTDPKDSLVMFMNQYRLAINFNTANNTNACLDALEKANNYITEDLGDYGKSEFYMFRGMLFLNSGNKIKAIKWLNKSKAVFQHPMIIAYVYRGLLDSHSDADSLDYYHRAIKDHLEKFDGELYQNVKREGYLGLKNYYFERGDLQNFNKVADYLFATMDTAEFYQKIEYHKLKIDQFSLKRLTRADIDLLGNYFSLLEEKYDSTIMKSTNKLRLEFDKSLTVKENEQLKVEQLLKEEQIQKQQKMLIGGVSAIGIFSLLSFLLYRQREKQKQLNETLTTQRDQIKLLNRELNHRVKNNLAFMTSLLEMQGRRTDSDETKQILRESESRLKALSIVHNNLFQNDTHTTINLKSYLLEIVQHLQNIFEIPGKSLQLETKLADLDFDAEDAMRVGLIVNELVTNSVKHAFANVDEPKIILDTTQSADGKIVLRYKDNGPGYVEKELKTTAVSSGSIGVKLIQLLERQLTSKLELQVI